MFQPSPNAPSTNQSTVPAACATWAATVKTSGLGPKPESSSVNVSSVFLNRCLDMESCAVRPSA